MFFFFLLLKQCLVAVVILAVDWLVRRVSFVITIISMQTAVTSMQQIRFFDAQQDKRDRIKVLSVVVYSIIIYVVEVHEFISVKRLISSDFVCTSNSSLVVII